MEYGKSGLSQPGDGWSHHKSIEMRWDQYNEAGPGRESLETILKSCLGFDRG